MTNCGNCGYVKPMRASKKAVKKRRAKARNPTRRVAPKKVIKKKAAKKKPTKRTKVAKTRETKARRSARLTREIAARKEKFLTALHKKPLTVREAAALVGRSERTIQDWAATDADFAERYAAGKMAQDKLRLTAIEDVGFRRIIKGTAAVALHIFYLKKLDPEGWGRADKMGIEHSGGLRVMSDDVTQLTDEQLAQRVLVGDKDEKSS